MPGQLKFAEVENTSYSMDFRVESDPSTPYVSAPSSLSKTSFSDMIPSSYSAPGSPTYGLTSAPLVWESGLTQVPKTDSYSGEFEFETSGRLKNTPNQEQKEMVEQLPAMSFADELFSNGQVLPLQLQFSGTQYCSVKKEEIKRTQRQKTQSSIPANCHQNNDEGCPQSPTGVPVPRAPIKQIVPASDQWRRRTRGPINPIRSGSKPESHHVYLTVSTFKPATDTGGQSSKVTRRRWRSFPKGSKRRMVRDFFLFKSALQGRSDPKDKLRRRTAALKINKDVKNSSSWSVQKTPSSEKKIKKSAPENTRKKVLVPQKPGLFVCLGLSSKGLKNGTGWPNDYE